MSPQPPRYPFAPIRILRPARAGIQAAREAGSLTPVILFRCPLRPFHHLRVPLLHLVERYVLDVVPDVPTVPERIAKDSRTFTVELVCGDTLDDGPGSGGTLHHCIGVVDVEVNCDARPICLGSPDVVFRKLVREHEGGAVEVQFGMADPAPRLAQAKLLFSAERLLVELDGPSRILHVKIRE